MTSRDAIPTRWQLDIVAVMQSMTYIYHGENLMSLQPGQTVAPESLDGTLTVKKLLGEGGQGTVYLVEGGGNQFALKWYNASQASAEQADAIRALVKSGPPKGTAGVRFVWPLDLVTAGESNQFGYLMPVIDQRRFAELGEVWARQKPAPGLDALCEISFQAANSYRALHLAGYCYRDISQGNLMFDPRTGDVLICDNDNVGINRQSECQILGTPGYMAPELIRDEAQPSTDTDLHSLAVLLFQLWIWHHPLHGEQEYRIRCWDLPAQTRVYGQNPVFIFDPNDGSNRLPNDPQYATAQRRWDGCPAGLRQLFTRAFTDGLRKPELRVTEGEWQRLFSQLRDGVLPCGGCRAVNLWESGQMSVACWHCRQPIAIPPKLVFGHANGRHVVLLTKTAKLRRRHVDPHDEQTADDIIGDLTQHPKDPSVWGLRNQGSTPWTATAPDGGMKEIAPQRSVSLTAGMKLNIGGATAEIEA